jgi:acetyl esterase/lipase
MPSSVVCRRVLLLTLALTTVGCASLRSRSADRRTPPPPAATPSRPTQTEPPPIANPAPPLDPVREEHGIVYGHGGGEELHLDLYSPRDSAGVSPAIVILHGGGWAQGTHADMRPVARSFAEKGYVATTVEYRLAPRHKFPAQLQDVKCAVRWLRANAGRCRIDPERLAVFGVSAGGHLALLVGLTEPGDGLEGDGGHAEQSSRVQVVVDLMGPTDLTRPGWSSYTEAFINDLMGGNRESMPSAFWAASPVAYVRRAAPPVLIIHGTQDQVVPYEQAKLLHDALRKARVPCRLETLHGKDHGSNWKAADLERSVTVIKEFLDKNLRQR